MRLEFIRGEYWYREYALPNLFIRSMLEVTLEASSFIALHGNEDDSTSSYNNTRTYVRMIFHKI